MKRALVCVAVLVACFAVVPMAAAKHHDGHHGGTPGTFRVMGTVTGVDAILGTVTIQPGHGHHWGHPSTKASLTLMVTATTQISTWGHDSTPLTLADVKAGDLVKAEGTVDSTDPAATVYTATQLSVKHVVPRFAVCGTVSAVDTNAGTVTLAVQKSSRHARAKVAADMVITVNADTKIVAWGKGAAAITLADIKVGDKVAACGTIDKTDQANPVYLAAKLLVKHPVQRFMFAGAVSATDGTSTLTVTVKWGSASLEGTDVAVLTTAGTHFFSFTTHPPTKITFADVKVGDKVMVRGTVDATDPAALVYTASGVMVWPAAPAAIHH